jgi:hypothetical protein
MFPSIQRLSDAVPSPAFVETFSIPDTLSEATQSARELSHLTQRYCKSHEAVRLAADAVVAEIIRDGANRGQIDALITEALALRRLSAESIYSSIEHIKEIKERVSLDALREYAEQFIRAMTSTLELLDNLIVRLQNLAGQAKTDEARVLRARPVKGKIDYAELSREHLARYPKIRARLAE